MVGRGTVNEGGLEWRDHSDVESRIFAFIPGRNKYICGPGFGSRKEAANFLSGAQAGGLCSLKDRVTKSIVAANSFAVVSADNGVVPELIVVLLAGLNRADRIFRKDGHPKSVFDERE